MVSPLKIQDIILYAAGKYALRQQDVPVTFSRKSGYVPLN
jgi:hypothetical protein